MNAMHEGSCSNLKYGFIDPSRLWFSPFDASSASSTLNLRVGDPYDFRDTPRHKEVSHEQEVYRPTVGRGTWHLPGHRQAAHGDVGEGEAGPNPAQGGCGWAGLAGCEDRGGVWL